MRSRFRWRIVAGASLLLLGAAAPPAGAKDPDPLTLTPDHFKRTAALNSDPATGITTISTEPGFVEHTGLMRTVWHDEFLQGFIDGRTGQKSYRVTSFVIYSGSPRSYGSAAFTAGDGPRSVKTTQLEFKTELCATGTCTYTERVSFPVEEETLRQAAKASSPSLWRFELIAKSGTNYRGALSTAEIAGLLARADETTSGVAAAATSVKTTAQRDLGIEGISVAATEDQPNRGGVLVAGVKGGSVAQKAGLIVGDIVYEFDGHPVRTLTDLQSAATANAKISLRLYRGLSTMTVTAQY